MVQTDLGETRASDGSLYDVLGTLERRERDQKQIKRDRQTRYTLRHSDSKWGASPVHPVGHRDLTLT